MSKNEFCDKKCAYCGKIFFRIDYSNYVYRENGKYFCSYNCWVKSEKKIVSTTQKKKPKNYDRDIEFYNLHRQGLSPQEISKKLNIATKLVNYGIRRIKDYKGE